MNTWQIQFIDGSSETVQGYRAAWTDGVLSIRTSHEGAYVDKYARFPLTNVKSWRPL